jgi:hypothetical protein
MARHGNHKGKKLRRYGGNATLGMSKHRKSGWAPRNRYAMVVNNLVFSREAKRREAIKVARRGPMFESVAEAMGRKKR